MNDFTSALLASGLVKNPNAFKKQPKKPNNEMTQFKTKNRLPDKPSSVLSFPIKSKNKFNTPSIEDVIIDRQLNPPLPPLPRDGPKRSSETYSQTSDISYLYEPKPKYISKSKEEIPIFDEDGEVDPNRVIRNLQANIGKNQLASGAAYEQLLNSLHCLTANIENDVSLKHTDKIALQTDAFNTILTEVVRQCSFESNAKGEIINQARNFMLDSANTCSGLVKKMKVQRESMQSVIDSLSAENETIKDNLNLMESKLKAEEKENLDLNDKLNHLKAQLDKAEQFSRDNQLKLKDNLQSTRDTNNALIDSEKKVQQLLQQITLKEDLIVDLNEQIEKKDIVIESEKRKQNLVIETLEKERERARKAIEQKKAAEQLAEEYKSQIKIEPEKAEQMTQTKLKIDLPSGMRKPFSKAPKPFEEEIPNYEMNRKNEALKRQIKVLQNQINQQQSLLQQHNISFLSNDDPSHPLFGEKDYNLTQNSEILENGSHPSALQNISKQKSQNSTKTVRESDGEDNDSEPEDHQLHFNLFGAKQNTMRTNKELKKLKNQYQKVREKVGDSMASMTMEEYEKVRTIILKENNNFDSTLQNMINAQNGNYSVNSGYEKECRLYAHTLVTNIFNRVFKANSHNSVFTQTETKFIQKIDVETMCSPENLTQDDVSKKFTQMLDPQYKDRPPKTFEWILKNLRSIFDEKMIKDAGDERQGNPVSSMPLFVIEWSHRQFGLDYLAQQCCWDLENSARVNQYKCLEIELFRRFLSGDLCTEELTFYLKVRRICMRRGLMYSTEDPRAGEKYPDTFLTSHAAIDIAENLLKRTSKEIHEETIKEIRDSFVQKPAITADPKMQYIRMTDMLNILLKTCRIHEITTLRLISTHCYITKNIPQSADFIGLLQSLFSAIQEPECAELYKLISHNKAHIQNTQEITIDDFVEMYHSRSLLTFDKTEFQKELIVDENSEENKRAQKEWDTFYPEFEKVIDDAKDRMNEQDVAHIVQSLNVELDSARACKICCDAHGLMSHIFSCITLTHQLRWALCPPDLNEMHKTITDFDNLLK